MAREFNPDPWNRTDKYVDRTYPSGVARERPKLTTRIHCEPEREATMREAALSGPAHAHAVDRIHEFSMMSDMSETEGIGEAVDRFHSELRVGHGWRNIGDD